MRGGDKLEEIWSVELKEEEEGGRNLYSGLPCSHHNGEGDEDAGNTENGHSSRGAVVRP